jgi:hypothetical protein
MTALIAAVLAPAINWEINFLVDYGPAWFLITHAVGLLALWCAAGIAVHAHERRTAHREGVAE